MAEDGAWLVAPTLVLHYVIEHAAWSFIEAVTSSLFAPA